ncbi:helix-turn-helix transcriptional regulator [Paraliobacillus sp. X-1268]|uniref:helix-turn-helix domain-containing protein n=1 Tax=Paraliobacillus sp. X-1268 TaxID=2213193 RepID=UPI000E3DB23F|nr:helix-turn-helix transcriptional regulator [Paraliobacillus sp. X-1268]
MAVKIRISELLGKHKMSQKELSIKTGIRPATISTMYHEQIKRIDIDHIDALCRVFDCTPNEIFEYTSNKRSSRYEEYKTDTNKISDKNNYPEQFLKDIKDTDMKLKYTNHGMIISNSDGDKVKDRNEDEHGKDKTYLYNITREYIEEILLDILSEKNKHNG